jgi:hypothetical protein
MKKELTDQSAFAIKINAMWSPAGVSLGDFRPAGLSDRADANTQSKKAM